MLTAVLRICFECMCTAGYIDTRFLRCMGRHACMVTADQEVEKGERLAGQ